MEMLVHETEMSVEKAQSRAVEVDNRVKDLPIMHEDLIIIERYDNTKTLTFLALAEGSIKNRMRTSWYGRVVAISPVGCGDDIREGKKSILKKDDVVVFNPDAAYSLNITGYEEIWGLHIDSVLVIDKQFDLIKMLKDNHEKVVNFSREIEQQKMRDFKANFEMAARQEAASNRNKK